MSTISLDYEDAQRLFDMFVSSLNFVSGLLETEDVEFLRKFAVDLGVDPEKATPNQFLAGYPHHPQQWSRPMSADCLDMPCDVARCDKPWDDPIHLPIPGA